MKHISFLTFFFPAKWYLSASLLCLSLISNLAWAQFKVEVSGVGLTQVPIAIASFKGEESAPQKTSVILSADLERSGQFRVVPNLGLSMDELSRPDHAMLRQRSADALVAGSSTRLADGRYEIRARLWDVVSGQARGDYRETVAAADLRLSAHRLADWVYERLTGEKGVFATRIAYITKTSNKYTLWIADSDGENAQMALTSAEPIISPSWSPNGTQLAYVSFESRKPVIYVHELATGKRKVMANFRGSNSAPAWAPDSNSLLATLSRDGGSQLYQIDVASGEAKRLTQNPGIDTEPSYSKDGSKIYFVSDRGGSPQIYRMNVNGTGAERVTFTGSYNISPALSPDGRWLTYISRVGGQFKVQVLNLSTGQANAITETSADERPSFAPNSKLIVYATVLQGREALMTSTLDGKIKARLAGQGGDIREPAWGPYR
ncbi:Tol-Pal system beta propeller repeat protein TolB [Limnohabitans sp. MMS-10A-178]|uniref:Tol-Pal system beta propeller repeat protein TolB n=1 Tax=Limnohabitans sp. MMS-10A-178 TaxID=1835767 RepID=UPI000D39236C|nr:Tol-Pal system beta propeller repeat protein TolB [Limnohabitans sp. MMS-10A-178]PUE14872.1 Tol-Pal system beta propeller repeat protein TolB [Limnohabitans sp. MMS-10A-178]